MVTQNKFRKILTRTALVGGLCLALTGCIKEYSKAELAGTQVYSNGLDQVFFNSQQEVWATQVGSDGRTLPLKMGMTVAGAEEFRGPFVAVYKDLPSEAKPYVLEYSRTGQLLQREIHMSRNQNIQPTSETRSAGKSTYQVENWNLEK
jgi:hypothetical protein